jgi:glycosyltransferase involved in cell wall biosynthesis
MKQCLPHDVRVTRAITVLSVYEGFFAGGARIVHTDMLLGLQAMGHPQRVLSIYGKVRREATVQRLSSDASYRRLVAGRVPVTALRKGFPGPEPFRPAELARVARMAADARVTHVLKEQPIGLLNQVGLAPGTVVVSLHRTDPENHPEALRELMTAVATGSVAALACCAESARDAYAAAGIPRSLLRVIPNGVDLNRFRPDSDRRRVIRGAFGIPADAPLVVLAARYDGMKDVPLFLAAASRFLRTMPEAHVLMCGAGMSADNPLLGGDLAVVGLEDSPSVHLAGVRDDPEAVFAAADVVALTSSHGEAAPLCLIEGMACGAVPVTTAVGDAAALVAGRGLVTSASPDPIAAAWQEALARRGELALAIRDSRRQFDRARMITGYASLLAEVTGPSTGLGMVRLNRTAW